VVQTRPEFFPVQTRKGGTGLVAEGVFVRRTGMSCELLQAVAPALGPASLQGRLLNNCRRTVVPIKGLRAGRPGVHGSQDDEAGERDDGHRSPSWLRRGRNSWLLSEAGLSRRDPLLCDPASRRVCLCRGALAARSTSNPVDFPSASASAETARLHACSRGRMSHRAVPHGACLAERPADCGPPCGRPIP
jgi:hypothetical protein